MKQYEAVIQVMRANGGFATLGRLYREVLQVPGAEWRSKTPFASIRRIVQDPRFFFKIRPGLWALNEYRDRIPFRPEARNEKADQAAEFSHTYYQGLLVEIGNLRRLETFVPNQDKNHKFLDKPLGAMASLEHCYHFTYDHLVNKAETVDVTWFNARRLPHSFFEVEYSTDFYNSLLKFYELQDFRADFRIVADRARFGEYQSKLALDAFRAIRERVKFVNYETVSQLHTRTYELSLIEQQL